MGEAGPPAPGRQSDLGQGLVEYGLIAALIAIFTVAGLILFGDAIASILDFISRAGSPP